MKNVILMAIIILSASCTLEINNSKDYSYKKPEYLSDNVRVSDIYEAKMDTMYIHRLNKDLVDEVLYNVHSVLVFKDEALVYEKYLCGPDEKHGRNLGLINHSVSDLHDTRSISKSVVSACVGIAIQKGLIRNENEPIKNFFPELCDQNVTKSNITIKNLLTMSSGLCWKEIGHYNAVLNDETKLDLSLHPIKFILNKKLAYEPGKIWNYSAGNTQLLAEIVKRVSGMSICEFASEYLFRPLGIENYQWISLRLSGIPAAASGLRLSSRSLLKVGMLYKDYGKFNGEKILDSLWVVRSTSSNIRRSDLSYLDLENGGYGYQFWTYEYEVKNKVIHFYEAKGNGGQSIFVCNELNLIVVITAGNYGQICGNKIPYQILENYILPAVL